jgi:hypothetical protein
MPVTLSPSPVRYGVWQVSVNRTVVVCFSGPAAREQARRRSRELAALLNDTAVELDEIPAEAPMLITTRR